MTESNEALSASDGVKRDRFRTLAHDFGFIEERAQDLVAQTAHHVTKMIEGEAINRRPANRRADLRSVDKHAHALAKRLDILDPRTVVTMMGSLEGVPPTAVVVADAAEDGMPTISSTTITSGLTPLRLIEYGLFRQQLTLVSEAASALLQQEPKATVGAPPTSDAIVFGMEALAVLWTKYRLEPISGSEIKHKFGLFVLQFFQKLPSPPRVAEVRTARRAFISERLTRHI